MNVNRYQFDREIRLHRFHLMYGINGRQAKEILQLVLFDIKSISDQQEYDCAKWEEECYRACADTIEAHAKTL